MESERTDVRCYELEFAFIAAKRHKRRRVFSFVLFALFCGQSKICVHPWFNLSDFAFRFSFPSAV